jgi:hypothetical protein
MNKTLKKATKKKIGYIKAQDLFDDLTKRATPVLRAVESKEPGSALLPTDIIEPGVETFYNGMWVRLPDNSIVMNHTVALVNVADPGRKYRYPLLSIQET